MISTISSLHSEETDSPVDSLSSLEPLLESIEDNHWDLARIEGLVLKAELLLYLNEVKTAEEVLQKIKLLANNNIPETTSIRINLLHLELLNNEAKVMEILNLHKTLYQQISTSDDSFIKAKVYLSIGASLYLLELFDGAIEELTKGYEIYKLDGNQFGMIDALNSLASVYTELKDYKLALEYHNEAYDYVIDKGNTYAQSILEYNIAGNYAKLEDYSNAIEFYTKAKTSGESADFAAISFFSEHRTASIYLIQEMWEEAVSLLLRVEQYYAKTNDNIFQFDAINDIVKAYIGMSDLDSATTYLLKSKALLTELHTPRRQIMHNTVAASLAYKKGEYKSGFEVLNKNIELIEQQFEEQQKQNAQKLKVRFDTELIESRNTALIESRKLDAIIISKQQNMMKAWFLIFCLGVLLVLTIFWALHNKEKQRELFERLAMTDPLTEAPNRRAILAFADQQITKTELNPKHNFFVGIADLDKFKQFNDTYGHDAGDFILRLFAKACKKTMKKGDEFGRFGGEEWLFVFCNSTESEIETVFENIKTYLGKQVVQGVPDSYDITFSMGVAKFDANSGNSLRDVINCADAMMYKAKTTGRNKLISST
ncbi:diguanylate cyclase [Alteromonas sp. 5E99-2]|nr:diguanylate cyclase [Alteromonas sp. 5E99-2]